MLGSISPRMMRIGLPHVDAWNVWWSDYGNNAEEFAALRTRVEEAAEQAGRAPGDVEATAAVFVQLPGGVGRLMGETYNDRTIRRCSCADLAAHLRAMADAGAGHVQLVLDPITLESIDAVGAAVREFRNEFARLHRGTNVLPMASGSPASVSSRGAGQRHRRNRARSTARPSARPRPIRGEKDRLESRGPPIGDPRGRRLHRAIAGTNPVDGHDVPVPHFGLVLTVEQFQALAGRLTDAALDFVIAPHVRFPGEPGEQWTMFFLDPSGNALEFKAFADPSQLFAR